MKAICRGIFHEKGDYYLTPGAPGREAGKKDKKYGDYRINRGTGWYDNIVSAKLLLLFEIDGENYKFDILSKFKDKLEWQKLTTKRVALIEEEMPDQIEVILIDEDDDFVRFEFDKKTFSEWIKRVKARTKK